MTTSVSDVGTVGRIPVRNLWLLMLYASQLYREIPSNRRYAVEENPDDIPDLVAEILTRAVERRLRRSLSHDFQRRHADLRRVRGRIDTLGTECRRLLQQGKIACSFDELTIDTARNQFVKAALNKLTKTVKDNHLIRRCRTTRAALEKAGVSSTLSENRNLVATVLHVIDGRTNAEDRRMLAAARLAFDLDLPTEDPGASYLPDPERDQIWARKLFEAAVGGFYDVTLSPGGWTVRTGGRIHWQIEQPTSKIEAILPSMQTDIVLERPPVSGETERRRTVIDTKFTHILGSSQYRELSLRSGYVYQLYAYLQSQVREDDPPWSSPRMWCGSSSILLFN